MASLSTQTQPRALLSHDCPTLERHVRALVVASQLEDRRLLVHILEAIPADVIACSSRSQAEEVLSQQAFEIVFCDERLPDGLYSDLLHLNRSDNKIPRVVVLTRNGDWELYFEAVNKGAFDVIRTPGCPSDVEMTVIRAVSEDDRRQISPARDKRPAMPSLHVYDVCPACGSDSYLRSHRRGLIERHILRALHLRPFRCLSCDARFYLREFPTSPPKHPSDVHKAVGISLQVGAKTSQSSGVRLRQGK